MRCVCVLCGNVDLLILMEGLEIYLVMSVCWSCWWCVCGTTRKAWMRAGRRRARRRKRMDGDDGMFYKSVVDDLDVLRRGRGYVASR